MIQATRAEPAMAQSPTGGAQKWHPVRFESHHLPMLEQTNGTYRHPPTEPTE